MTEKFERHLRESNLSENTVASYLFAVKQYQEQYDKVTQRTLESLQGLADRELQPQDGQPPAPRHELLS